jgi:hypothetical protein
MSGNACSIDPGGLASRRCAAIGAVPAILFVVSAAGLTPQAAAGPVGDFAGGQPEWLPPLERAESVRSTTR